MDENDSVKCIYCRAEDLLDLPVRENVWSAQGWNIVHAYDSSLVGWLVVFPTRHVEALDELTDSESSLAGIMLRDVSRVLKTVTGCVKTYVALFAEAPGCRHLHFHVVPRMIDLSPARQHSAVFAYLDEEPLTEDVRDAIAQEVRAALLNLSRSGQSVHEL